MKHANIQGGTSLNEEMREFELPLMLDCLEKIFTNCAKFNNIILTKVGNSAMLKKQSVVIRLTNICYW